MRAWRWLAAAVVVSVAGIGVTPAEAQRGGSSRLAQMMQSMAENMGSVASRISSGMIRIVGGSNSNTRPQLFREAPQAGLPSPQVRPQRQRTQPRPVDAGEGAPAKQAPNAPRPVRQRVEKPVGGGKRRRVSFRQFVDTTMAGIASFIPNLQRRVQNRRRHTRELEFQ